MGKRHEAIGIKQAIRFEWMQKAANLLLVGLDAKTIRQELHEFLADRKGNGSEGERSDQTRTFVVNNLMKIWSSPDPELIPFRDASLAFLRENPSMALAVHWGMISAVYPFWFNVARQTGRLLALQEQVTQTQIINRLKEQYGDRQTVSRYARYVIRSFVAWGALKDSDSKGCYRKSNPITVSNPIILSLLVEATLYAHNDGKMDKNHFLNHPALFKFTIDPFSVSSITKINHRISVDRYNFKDELMSLNKPMKT